MENRSHALMAGFFTIALLTLAILMAVWLGRDKIKRVPYEIVTKAAVSGLNLQALVRYKGIKVGNVTDIAFDDNNPGQIILRLEVKPDTPVTTSTFATLSYQGVTGIAFVQLDDDGSSKTVLVQDSTAALTNVVPRIPLRPGMIQNLEQRGQAILGQTEEMMRKLNVMLDPNSEKSVVTAIDNFNKAAVAWKALPAKLEPTLVRLPELADQAKSSLMAIRHLSTDVSKLTNNLNQFTSSLQSPDGSLARLNLAIDQINTSLTVDTLPRIQNLTGEARTTLRSFSRTSDAINERPQSLLFGKPAVAPGPGEPGFVAPK